MKRSTVALLLLAILALGLALPACGESGSDETPTPGAGSGTPGGGDNGGGSSTQDTPLPTATVTSAQVGTPMQFGDATISLDSVTIDNEVLTAAFTVDNTKGTVLITVPGTGFEAFAPDNTSLNQDILCSTMPGKAEAGKKVQGNICWKAPGATATKGLIVRYIAGKDTTFTWNLP
jgi:hypothetical protein